MRKSKFRGVTTFFAKPVYGDLLHYEDGAVAICPVGKDESAEVYPGTVAQFVGYDKNGKEIYSDDTIIEEIFPGAVPQKYIAGDRIPVNRIGEKFFNYELLKEKKMKICKECGKEISTQDNRVKYCSADCRLNHEKKRTNERQHKYRAENKEKFNEYHRKYHAENKEKVNERRRKHYAENKEKFNEYQRKYRAENKEKVAEWNRKYRAENKEKVNEYQRKYYLKKFGEMKTDENNKSVR